MTDQGLPLWRYNPWITADIIDCDGIGRYQGFQLTLGVKRRYKPWI